MQLQAFSLSLPLFSLLLSVLCMSAAADSVIYVQCSQLHFTSNTPYESNLNSLFTSLVESASVSNFNTFKISPPGNSPNDVVYGLFQCQGDLSVSDCRDCVSKSVSPLKTTCPVSIGGTIQSEGCLVKYDNTSFFGVEDKTEVLKRCGPSIGDHNLDVLNSRNDALAYLNTAPNGQYFRMGGSGSVQGVAQCIQDLSVTDCQDCVAEAGGKLRSECETSSLGEMYLGKCYIRYADHSIDNGTSYTDNDNDNTNENHGGAENYNNILKIVGIIVAAIFGTSGLSYCFSVSITKNLLQINANNTNQIRTTNVMIQGELEKGMKSLEDLAMKKSEKIGEEGKKAKEAVKKERDEAIERVRSSVAGSMIGSRDSRRAPTSYV